MGRALGLLGSVVTLAVGMYIYSVQVRPQAGAGGGSNAETANLALVKADLLAIANAERGHLASQGNYVSLEELTSRNYISIKGERPPYIYNVEAGAGTFRVTATRTTKGAPAQIWVGDDMLVQASD